MLYRKHRTRKYVYRNRRINDLWRMVCLVLVLCVIAFMLTTVSRSGNVLDFQSIEQVVPLKIPVHI